MKKKNTLKPDSTLKDYWSDNSRFADLFNQVFFDGEASIEPERLSDRDTDSSMVIKEKEIISSLSKARDVIKQYGDEAELVLLGLENQMLSDFWDKDCYPSRLSILANSEKVIKIAV